MNQWLVLDPGLGLTLSWRNIPVMGTIWEERLALTHVLVKAICFVNLMWTLQMCDGAEATSFYRLAISWISMAPLPWPSKETLQRKKPRSSSDGGNSEVALALNSEGLGVNANWLDFAVYEHLCGCLFSKYLMCYWCPSFKLFFKWKGLWNNIMWASFPQMGLSKWTCLYRKWPRVLKGPCF